MSEWPQKEELYPIKFTPIYQERIWGGTLMHEHLHRTLPATAVPIGESWELSDRSDACSVAVNGELAGKTLRELREHYGSDITGPKADPHAPFPLLVKLIDAGDRLSLQVHPDKIACKRIGGDAEPKTEMWYIIAARKDGNILAGLSQRATQLQFRDKMDTPEVEQLLQVYPSMPGDAFFIPSGTLHAIGGGNLILEIQQNSDTTYRISDWGRTDANGKSRELHVEKGMMSIDFMNRTSPRIAGVSDKAPYNRKFTLVDKCRFFQVDNLHLAETWFDDTLRGGSFHLISAVDGEVAIIRRGHQPVNLAAGETALLPFCTGKYEIKPLNGHAAAVVKATL